MLSLFLAWLFMFLCFFFFFNDTATTEIYTLSLHDALPICHHGGRVDERAHRGGALHGVGRSEEHTSELQAHSFISYAVFCLKKNEHSKLTMVTLSGGTHHGGGGARRRA